MSATLHGLLPADAGIRIPGPVREALNEMAAVCNAAAANVNLAFIAVQQTTHYREVQASRPAPGALQGVVVNLESAAESFHAQSMVVLTQAATIYAAYASQVADAVATDRQIPLPGSTVVKPSGLIAAPFLYLSPVRFTSATQAGLDVVRAQNDEIAGAYERLEKVINQQLHDKDPAIYDDPAAVAVGGYWAVDATDRLGEALHAYAATLTAAIGILTAADEADAG